ncbi:MAG: septal ring lytic transglycosylase RlpA family protein, partial [Spirochaetaceae bacterium]|nr:septal ring lytic transglycosylase RlpA family protein [Spirochaetaceae bacterium]
MKKYVLFLAVPVIMAVMTSGSVWEGAAALGTNGELPDSGYYAASSSFPRNTVVDVTNLETRKTVRVIIAGPLESPGLLALLSRDAASSIGLSGRSVGRIRISQPADPVAFSRFTGESALSGDTDFDPRAAVAANYPHILGPVDAAGGQTQSRPDASAPYTGIVDLPPGGFIPAAAGSPDEGIRGEPVPESAWVYPEEIIGEDEAVPPVLAETALPENGYDLPEYTAPPGEPESGEETYE